MSTEVEIVDLTEIVGDIEIPCDYSAFECCNDGPARWVVRLVPCACGRAGARLICEDCKSSLLANDELAAECGACGDVIVPFRHVFASIEALDKSAVR